MGKMYRFGMLQTRKFFERKLIHHVTENTTGLLDKGNRFTAIIIVFARTVSLYGKNV
jgi:hypothetical protein